MSPSLSYDHLTPRDSDREILMAIAYLGIGSNVGNRAANIALAVTQLRLTPGIRSVRLSPIYETDPVGPIAQECYLNAVAELDTTLPPQALGAALQCIEIAAGREPLMVRQKWGPRVLDLDLLLYDQLVLDTPDLIVPHPRMHERWFVLKPLADLAPDIVHPVLGVTIHDLLTSCDATG